MMWDELDFWQSGEWQVIQEKLDDLAHAGGTLCPARENLFRALDLTPFDNVRVVIVGQDPYPNPGLATGLAFDVPAATKVLPPTLVNILKEYHDDLHYPIPAKPDLSIWASRGVLLWNCIPSCEAWKSMSHYPWTEWSYLTKEIIKRLQKLHLVFAFIGGVAQEFAKYAVEDGDNYVIRTSHPSPRGAHAGNSPFIGSRLFSTINGLLVQQALKPINWELKEEPPKATEKAAGKRILESNLCSLNTV